MFVKFEIKFFPYMKLQLQVNNVFFIIFDNCDSAMLDTLDIGYPKTGIEYQNPRRDLCTTWFSRMMLGGDKCSDGNTNISCMLWWIQATFVLKWSMQELEK